MENATQLLRTLDRSDRSYRCGVPAQGNQKDVKGCSESRMVPDVYRGMSVIKGFLYERMH